MKNELISRKRFLKIAGASLGGLYLSSWLKPQDFQASPAPARIIIHLLLEGGPDLRHLLVPPYSSDQNTFAGRYWKFRSSAQQTDANIPSTWQDRYVNDYTEVTSSGVTFGVLNRCGWLVSQIQAGNVAIINNVIHSDSRRHDHSLLVLQSGILGDQPLATRTIGWGGRLSEASGGRILSMTNQVRVFCNRPDGDRNQIISARDTRNIGLHYADALTNDPASEDPRAVMTRAMRSYYSQKPRMTGTMYERFQAAEEKVRLLGDQMRARLDANPVPQAIDDLVNGASPLNRRNFGEQIRSVYDSFLCADLTEYQFRVMSLNYSGWDTHQGQRTRMGNNLEDIFGTGRGLDALTSSLSTQDRDRTIFVIAGEFGRQLRSNGDQGTDHGRGNNVIVIGNPVTGGVYGDMFPASDIPNFEIFNRDITGLTSLDQIFGRLCDWHSGTGSTVFPGYTTTPIEAGVDFTNLAV